MFECTTDYNLGMIIFEVLGIWDRSSAVLSCSGADICPKCWTLMTIAIRILDRALRGESEKRLIFTGLKEVQDKSSIFLLVILQNCLMLINFHCYLCLLIFFSGVLQMTSVSGTACGCTLAGEGCIAGCVTRPPGSSLWRHALLWLST